MQVSRLVHPLLGGQQEVWKRILYASFDWLMLLNSLLPPLDSAVACTTSAFV